MKLEKKDIFYIIVIVSILIFGISIYFNKLSNMNNKFDQYEGTIKALNDSIKVSVKNGITEYSKLSPSMDPKDFINSEAFKTLSEQNKQYYKEILNIKGLLAASQIELIKQGNDLARLKGINPGIVRGDSITYKKGDTLNFAQQDTTKKLKWDGKLVFKDSPEFLLNYIYKVNIGTTFTKLSKGENKGLFEIKYKIDDPELKTNNIQSFVIPDTRTNFQKWVSKNKVPLIVSGALASFAAGTYIGVKISK